MPFHLSDCWPLSLTRSIQEFPIGNISLAQHQRRIVESSNITVNPCAWITRPDFLTLMNGEIDMLTDSLHQPIAWKGNAASAISAVVATSSFIIRYSWDLLRANELYVSELDQSVILGDVHSSAVVEGILHLGEGTRILPGVFIEGNVVIGSNCKIGPNCYIRGNTSIGNHCHIGQSVEIKNCLILSHSNVGHLSYVGDSVLGEKVNLGAGTTVSNLRHDGATHRSMVGETLVDTGRRKFGAIIGDHVHTGINTSIYPGRKLWPNTSTRPGEIVQRDICS